jgi:hypothetical protein
MLCRLKDGAHFKIEKLPCRHFLKGKAQVSIDIGLYVGDPTPDIDISYYDIGTKYVGLNRIILISEEFPISTSASIPISD